jgi:hypothetical protein
MKYSIQNGIGIKTTKPTPSLTIDGGSPQYRAIARITIPNQTSDPTRNP